MFNPLQPIDLAPPDGDFARYVERLNSAPSLTSGPAEQVPRGRFGPLSSTPSTSPVLTPLSAQKQEAPATATSSTIPPDLDVLLQTVRGKLKPMLIIGIVWLLLGLGIEIPFFRDTVLIGVMLVVGSILMGNKLASGKRS